MIIANRPLNLQALALEEVETKIRIIVKTEYFKRTPKAFIDEKVYKLIAVAEKAIKIPSLAIAARRSLLRFYTEQYNELMRSFGWQLGILSALFLLQGKTLFGRDIKPSKAQKAQAVQMLESIGFEPPSGGGTAYSGETWDEFDYDASRQLGSPLQKFSERYMRDNVRLFRCI